MLLKKVSLNINKGDRISVIAVNGAGNSSILNVLYGEKAVEENIIGDKCGKHRKINRNSGASWGKEGTMD